MPALLLHARRLANIDAELELPLALAARGHSVTLIVRGPSLDAPAPPEGEGDAVVRRLLAAGVRILHDRSDTESQPQTLAQDGGDAHHLGAGEAQRAGEGDEPDEDGGGCLSVLEQVLRTEPIAGVVALHGDGARAAREALLSEDQKIPLLGVVLGLPLSRDAAFHFSDRILATPEAAQALVADAYPADRIDELAPISDMRVSPLRTRLTRLGPLTRFRVALLLTGVSEEERALGFEVFTRFRALVHETVLLVVPPPGSTLDESVVTLEGACLIPEYLAEEVAVSADVALVVGTDESAGPRTLEALGYGLPCVSASAPFLGGASVGGTLLPTAGPVTADVLAASLAELHRPSRAEREVAWRAAEALEGHLPAATREHEVGTPIATWAEGISKDLDLDRTPFALVLPAAASGGRSEGALAVRGLTEVDLAQAVALCDAREATLAAGAWAVVPAVVVDPYRLDAVEPVGEELAVQAAVAVAVDTDPMGAACDPAEQAPADDAFSPFDDVSSPFDTGAGESCVGLGDVGEPEAAYTALAPAEYEAIVPPLPLAEATEKGEVAYEIELAEESSAPTAESEVEVQVEVVEDPSYAAEAGDAIQVEVVEDSSYAAEAGDAIQVEVVEDQSYASEAGVTIQAEVMEDPSYASEAGETMQVEVVEDASDTSEAGDTIQVEVMEDASYATLAGGTFQVAREEDPSERAGAAMYAVSPAEQADREVHASVSDTAPRGLSVKLEGIPPIAGHPALTKGVRVTTNAGVTAAAVARDEPAESTVAEETTDGEAGGDTAVVVAADAEDASCAEGAGAPKLPPVLSVGEVLTQARRFHQKRRAAIAAAQPDEATRLQRQAQEDVEAGDRTEAIAKLKRAIELAPDELDPRIALGTLLGEDPAELEAAKKELYAAIALRPTSAAPYRALGIACARANELEDAQRFFNEALALDPEDAVARKGLERCRGPLSGPRRLLRRLVGRDA